MIKKIFAIIGLFILAQFLSGAIGTLVLNLPELLNGRVADPLVLQKNLWGLGLSLLLGDIILVGVLILFKLVRKPVSAEGGLFGGKKNKLQGWYFALISMVPLLLFVNILTELLGAVDLHTEQFARMSHNWVCVLAIIVFGPLVEEYVFREGMQRQLMLKGMGQWGAIVVSALAFGIVHFNPAQSVGAFFIGMVFGWFYARVGSIKLSFMAHMLNNGIGVIFLYASVGNISLVSTIKNALGITSPVGGMLAVLGVLAVLGLLAFAFLMLWSKQAPRFAGREEFIEEK